MAEQAPRVRIGPAGWSYPDWEGPVYPVPRPRGFDPLAFLAARFDLVEINSTFYRMPEAHTSGSWARRVEPFPAFRFTAKLHRGFTHPEEGLPAPREDARRFREGIAPLVDSGRLGALLLQFPWSFRADEPSRDRLKRLLEAFQGLPLVVELRHVSWNVPATFELLRVAGAGIAAVDQPPSRGEMPLLDAVTSRIGYVRLHGRNSAAWFDPAAGRDARYDWLYTDEELDPIETVARRIAAAAEETFIVTNNHFRGKAVQTAVSLLRRLQGRVPDLPFGTPPAPQRSLFDA